ncbi:D-2-hydroxyacid dehydrogenase [Oleiharenicola lentus]|uniref:D-2-hydroxyacid dehydrogenase n=1 Tax=Oleiharenicola lentus TaxID=2508720 RepID=UPI003F6792F8
MKTIWTNHDLRPSALALFKSELDKRGYRLIQSASSTKSVLAQGAADPALAEADIAYGQPDVADSMQLPNLKWIALSTAGYTRYDRDDFRAALKARGAVATNASSVFADPCAQQMLASMLALARNLPSQLRNQDGARAWCYLEDRFTARVITGQSVLLLGYGAIAKRMVELLTPFGCKITAYRRKARGDEAATIVDDAGLPAAFGTADHVINILPDAPETKNFMNAARFAQVKPGARFYNVGRGTTVDQLALIAALESGHLDAAYLDVMDPEPLPPEHPLWKAKNCFITCHIGGGTGDQDDKLIHQFMENLRRFETGEPMIDRIA